MDILDKRLKNKRDKDRTGLPPDVIDAVNLRRRNLQQDLKHLQRQRKAYEEKWEANLSQDTRESVQEIWETMTILVRNSEQVADRLKGLVESDKPLKEEIEECYRELNTNTLELNNKHIRLNT